MKCGRGHEHANVAAVRVCYSLNSETSTPAAPARITPKQLEFLNTLRVERGYKPLAADVNISKREASEAIRDLMLFTAQPLAGDFPVFKSPPGVTVPDVPTGFYAVPSATGSNDLDFFRIDSPTEGTWAGRTFVKRIVGGDKSYRIPTWQARAALTAIAAAGPDAAAKRYGQEIGRCGKCNRSLTDEESRAYGIGPICRDMA